MPIKTIKTVSKIIFPKKWVNKLVFIEDNLNEEMSQRVVIVRIIPKSECHLVLRAIVSVPCENAFCSRGGAENWENVITYHPGVS